MYLADTHMHSTVSFDGKNTRKDMARAAAGAGLSTICFTDHYDVINEKGEYVPTYDWSAARREHREIEGHPGLEVLYGIEMGNAPADFHAAEQVLQEPGLDFVIGSIHNASVALGGQDYYYVDYAARPELCRAQLEDYLAQELALVKWGNFDTLGHLPYPLRYMRDKCGQVISLKEFPQQVSAILKAIAERGKAIEVNTNRARTPLDDYIPLLKEYRDLGGELVTVGADAHQKADVGRGVKEAYALLEACGFRYVAVFRERKPEMIRL